MMDPSQIAKVLEVYLRELPGIVQAQVDSRVRDESLVEELNEARALIGQQATPDAAVISVASGLVEAFVRRHWHSIVDEIAVELRKE
jgi:hypothetical protein